jgi:hypothetical protein
MAAVVSGDIVQSTNLLGLRRVVIDVIVDPPWPTLAALRLESEPVPQDPDVVPIEELEVVGHLTEIEGWEEIEHGLWVRSP